MKLQLSAPWAAQALPRMAQWCTEYFQHHGAWAPAVRLLRVMTMQRKAWLLFAVFSIPLTVLTVSTAHHSWEHLKALALTRQGLQFSDIAQRLGPALYSASTQNTGTPPPKPTGATAPSIEELQAQLAQQYAAMPQLHVYAQAAMKNYLHAQAQSRAAASATPAERALILQNQIRALLTLREEITNASGIWREADHGAAALVELSQETLSVLGRGVTAVRRTEAQLIQIAAEQPVIADKVHEQQLVLAKQLAHVEAALSRLSILMSQNPQLGLAAPGEKTLAATRQWLGTVEQSLLSREVLADPVILAAQSGAVLAATRELRTTTIKMMDEYLTQRQKEALDTAYFMLAVMAGLLSLAIYFLLAFLKVMSGGISMLTGEMNKLAQGDLSSRPEARGDDEIAVMTTTLGASLMRLSDLLASMRLGVASVTHASTEIAHGNTNLSQRTDRAATSVASILEVVTHFSKELDECGQQVVEANRAVDALRLEGVRSKKHMGKLQQTMQALLGKSREIGEIVGLIDGIAYRTNILALNASVEAAKAGESGRGFAVVAQEVRSLALRSADSAKRISDIVVRSTDDIEQGNALAELAGQSLEGSNAYVVDIHTAMDRIVSLTRSGQNSAEHITTELRTLNDSTSENRNLVNQLAQAADAMRRQGERLTRKVDAFRLK
jgi:methyl-accepting chemotaxis protein I, serine sensor receptor